MEIPKIKKLGVNIDHVATVRQARGTRYPDPVSAAVIAEASGADQITIHLREDRRHIQEADLRLLRQTVTTDLNLELAANDEVVSIACEVRPDIATFVPERREELTTEGGLDVVKNFSKLKVCVDLLNEVSTVSSMFIAPEIEQIEASRETGAKNVEFHTGAYAEFADHKDKRMLLELERIKKAVEHAKKLGLYVAAGHGLNYDNTPLIVKEVPNIVEYNIGHAIVARAIFVGLARAVEEMKQLIQGANL